MPLSSYRPRTASERAANVYSHLRAFLSAAGLAPPRCGRREIFFTDLRVQNFGRHFPEQVATHWFLAASAARPASLIVIRTIERASARDHAFGCRGRQPSDAQINHLLECEAVREHDRLSRAVARAGEQFEHAAAGGGRVALARVAA
jgi:hypothetical protein